MMNGHSNAPVPTDVFYRYSSSELLVEYRQGDDRDTQLKAVHQYLPQLAISFVSDGKDKSRDAVLDNKFLQVVPVS